MNFVFRVSAFLSLLSLYLCCWSRYDIINLTQKKMNTTLVFRFFWKKTHWDEAYLICMWSFEVLCLMSVLCQENWGSNSWYLVGNDCVCLPLHEYSLGNPAVCPCMWMHICAYMSAVATILPKVQFVVLIVALQILMSYFVISNFYLLMLTNCSLDREAFQGCCCPASEASGRPPAPVSWLRRPLSVDSWSRFSQFICLFV